MLTLSVNLVQPSCSADSKVASNHVKTSGAGVVGSAQASGSVILPKPVNGGKCMQMLHSFLKDHSSHTESPQHITDEHIKDKVGKSQFRTNGTDKIADINGLVTMLGQAGCNVKSASQPHTALECQMSCGKNIGVSAGNQLKDFCLIVRGGKVITAYPGYCGKL